MLRNYITRMRRRMNIELGQDPILAGISPLTFSAEQAFSPIMGQYVRGTVLDAGAGAQNDRERLLRHATSYLSLDVEARGEPPDFIDDIQTMDSVPDASIDTVFCSSVLEHVPNPWMAVSAMNRVLKPGGNVLIIVPHLSALHEEPHDYYRFTQYGIRTILEAAGFRIIQVQRAGGLLALVAHPFCLLALSLAWGVPRLGWPATRIFATCITRPLTWLDAKIGMSSHYPATILAVGKKPE